LQYAGDRGQSDGASFASQACHLLVNMPRPDRPLRIPTIPRYMMNAPMAEETTEVRVKARLFCQPI
jgi:hypothetical protein